MALARLLRISGLGTRTAQGYSVQKVLVDGVLLGIALVLAVLSLGALI